MERVFGSTDSLSRCLEFLPDAFEDVTAVSRFFRSTTTALLERSLDFVRDHGEHVLDSIVISESARVEWEKSDEYYYEKDSSGGCYLLENRTVHRELPKDALAAFKYAWIVAPGEAMAHVVLWNSEIARHRWLWLVECGHHSPKDRHGRDPMERVVASFERPFRTVAAYIDDSKVCLGVSREMLEMFGNWWVKCGIVNEWDEILHQGFMAHVTGIWADARLAVSFLLGPVDVIMLTLGRGITTMADCDHTVQSYLEYSTFRSEAFKLAFRQAWEEIDSSVSETPSPTVAAISRRAVPWDHCIALDYARRVSSNPI
mmetsp:Transcript_28948/g.95790  ORF Transcript_28948/g.95790 Transcript_28948/m.95790 type:complete len:315 (-) Transcript_28948:797-1741(-)